MSKPKILLGTYIYDGKKYAFEKFIRRCQEMMDNYDGEIEMLIIDNSKTPDFSAWMRLYIDKMLFKDKVMVSWMKKSGRTTREKQKRAQKVLWEQTVQRKCEYLFIVESDVYPPKDAITRLLAHKKKVMSGVYSFENDERGDMLCLMGYATDHTGDRYWEPASGLKRLKKKVGAKPLKVYSCGLGCILIHKQVLKTIKPYYDSYKDTKFYKAVDEGVTNLKVYYEMDSTMSNYLEQLIKKMRKNAGDIAKKKIHPDACFHRDCELYKVNRYVDLTIECVHNSSNWSECKVPR